MIVNHEKRWLYVGPPKTGSTTMHTELAKPPFGGSFVKAGAQHDVHVPAGCEKYLKFVTVRDPYARATSLYWHYLTEIRGIEAAKFGVEPAYVLPFRTDMVPFTFFMGHLADGKPLPLISPDQPVQNFYLKPVSWWLRDFPRDATLKLEFLDEQYAALPIWHDKGKLPGFGKYNAPNTPGWQVMINPPVIDMIERWAAEDFKQFRYPTLPFPKRGTTWGLTDVHKAQ